MAVQRSLTSFPLPQRRRGYASTPAPLINSTAVTPFLACLFATVIEPLIVFSSGTTGSTELLVTVNRTFWPAVGVLAISISLHQFSRHRRVYSPLPIIFLAAYLLLAGVSALWAFSSESTILRFVRQLFTVASVVLPAIVAYRRPDLLRVAFVCFAIGTTLNFYFVFQNPVEQVMDLNGYSGYFFGKNYLGQLTAIAFILAIYEFSQRGLRRLVGVIIGITAITLLVWSNSKTAFALAVLMPFVASFVLLAQRWTNLSPALLLFSLVVGYFVMTNFLGITANRISYEIYGDPTFTGRTIIWDFVDEQISRRPLLGWGYQSFWLVGPHAPSVVEAPGWVRVMPNAHNGFRDVMVELGYAGLAILLCFIFATLHIIGRIASRDLARGWTLLTLALFVISYNFLESLWFRGYEFLWIVFLIVAAETVRDQRRAMAAPDAARQSPHLRHDPRRAVRAFPQTRAGSFRTHRHSGHRPR